jgi:hypothetical protein
MQLNVIFSEENTKKIEFEMKPRIYKKIYICFTMSHLLMEQP